MLLAAAPLLAFHAFTNWDLLAVAFAAGGLLAWSKTAPAIAGILIGFGAATKAYPLLMLVALGLLAYRAGRLRAWRRCAALGRGNARACTYAVVWPFAGSYVDDAGHRHNNLWRFVELNSGRTADWDSLAYVAQYLGRTESAGERWPGSRSSSALASPPWSGYWRRSWRAALITAAVMAIVTIGVTQTVSYAHSRGAIPHSVLNTAGAVWGIFLVAVIGYIVLTAPRRPRVPQIAFLVVVGVPGVEQGRFAAVLALAPAAGRARVPALAACCWPGSSWRSTRWSCATSGSSTTTAPRSARPACRRAGSSARSCCAQLAVLVAGRADHSRHLPARSATSCASRRPASGRSRRAASWTACPTGACSRDRGRRPRPVAVAAGRRHDGPREERVATSCRASLPGFGPACRSGWPAGSSSRCCRSRPRTSSAPLRAAGSRTSSASGIAGTSACSPRWRATATCRRSTPNAPRSTSRACR